MGYTIPVVGGTDIECCHIIRDREFVVTQSMFESGSGTSLDMNRVSQLNKMKYVRSRVDSYLTHRLDRYHDLRQTSIFRAQPIFQI